MLVQALYNYRKQRFGGKNLHRFFIDIFTCEPIHGLSSSIKLKIASQNTIENYHIEAKCCIFISSLNIFPPLLIDAENNLMQ